jgi:hypothetical protein
MNIFYLDPDPKKAAEYHADKHCVKMILESAQLLSTAHHVLDGYKDDLYKKTHENHPSAVWVRKNRSNYKWLYELLVALMEEYTYRYGKVHKTTEKLDVLKDPPLNMVDGEFTPPTPAMPTQYITESVLDSYRSYYIGDKSHLFNWTRRDVPEWIE